MAATAYFPSFNDSDAVHHLTRRHVTYIGKTRKSICFRPADFIVSDAEECYYVSMTESCLELVQVFNYLKILVCDLKIGRSLMGAAKIVTFTMLVVFMGVFCLIMITKYFILPNMLTLSHNLVMTGYIFGIIINSTMLLLPTMFHVLFRIQCYENPRSWSAAVEPATMRICTIFGQLVPMLLIGFMLISLLGYYRVPPRSLLLNIMGATFGQIYIRVVGMHETFLRNVAPQPNYVLRIRIHCGILLLLYCGHFFGHIIFWCSNSEKDRAKEIRRRRKRYVSSLSQRGTVERVRTPPKEEPKVETKQRNSFWAETWRYCFGAAEDERNSTGTRTPSPNATPTPPPSPIVVQQEPKTTALSMIVYTLNAFEHLKNWPFYAKVVVCPLWVVLALMIPVFDEERPLNGWCKYLLCFSLLAAPMLLYRDSSSSPLWFVVLGMVILLVLGILIKTKANKPPEYFYNRWALIEAFSGTGTISLNSLSLWIIINIEFYVVLCSVWNSSNRLLVVIYIYGAQYFSILGTFNGLILFYVINAELRNMVYQILSYMNDWSRDALTLIAQPVGVCFSLGAFCWTLVESHRPELAYGALISLLHFSTFILLPEVVFNPCFSAINQMTITDNAVTSFVFLIIANAFLVISASMTDFRLRCSHGIFYLLLLSLYLLFSCLANSDRIHTYGNQHSLLLDPAYSNANWA